MRQRKGIDLAKQEGKYLGRVKKYHDNHAGMNHAVQLYKEGKMTVKKYMKFRMSQGQHYTDNWIRRKKSDKQLISWILKRHLPQTGHLKE